MLSLVGFWLMLMSLVFIIVMLFLADGTIEAKEAVLGVLAFGLFLAMLLAGCYLIG